jgi:4-hydroxybenzoyl-CoA thioesterase
LIGILSSVSGKASRVNIGLQESCCRFHGLTITNTSPKIEPLKRKTNMLINRRVVRIEWGDCDPAGIVWYPRYFGMFDAATASLFEKAGWLKPVMLARFDAVGFPMVDTRAQFHIPSKYGEDIIIESQIAAWRRSSFDVAHRVFKGDKLAIEASEIRVWVGKHPDDPTAIKSRPIPEEVIVSFR